MSLCWQCSSIEPTYIGAHEFRRENDPKYQPPAIGTIPLRSAIDLPERALSCPLCALFYEGYNREFASVAGSEGKVKSRLLDKPIRICYEAVAPHWFLTIYPPGAQKVRYREKLWIRGMVAFIPVEGAPNELLEVRLDCYAEDETPAAFREDITGCAPISHCDCEEAHRRTSVWLKNCHRDNLRRHEKCSRSISGIPLSRSFVYGTGVPRLPTRVVDVGSGRESTCLRLLESDGLAARYWALSHCWGPREMQPPKTTKANLLDHRRNIDFDALPKSFRDAITFTRGQGVRYIWIDSLCIIQDSPEDWESESKQMARVYEQAEVVLVASDAAHPQGGLFFDRTPSSKPVELPYYYLNKDGNVRTSGSYFVWLNRSTPQARSEWYKGPLSERGWALQEWFLSQRRIYFTKSGMYWECSDVCYDERGSVAYSGPSKSRVDHSSYWEGITETYSEMKFTYLTDRLIALEGLRSRFPGTNQDNYIFGHWRDNLPATLLWKTKEKANRQDNPLKVPTWTWASVLSSIAYLEYHGSMDSLVQDLIVDDSGQIRMTALIKAAPRILQLVQSTDTEPLDKASSSTTLAQLRGAPESLPEGDDFVICSDDSDLIGVAYLDDYDLDQVSRGVFVIAVVGFPPGSEDRQSDPNTAYRVLLGRQSGPSSQDKYMRVGVGKVFAAWLENPGESRSVVLE